MRISISVFLAAGCTAGNPTEPAVSPVDAAPAARTLNIQLAVVDQLGGAVELNRFKAPEDVYLTVRQVDRSNPVTEEDFEFSVIDSSGQLLSSDDPSCRQFHVDDDGHITGVKQMCLHKIAAGPLIGVAPFRETTNTMTLVIRAIADGKTLSVPFVVE